MSLMVLVIFVLGLAALVGGAEVFVRGAARIAVLIGISPLVVGLTVVAFGTSAPETAVVVQAAWTGQADIGIGNVVGSNICNVLFILGLAAVLVPLVVARRVVRLDVPLMIGVSFLLLFFCLDGRLSTGNGAVLFGAAVAYCLFQVRWSRREHAAVRTDYEEEYGVDLDRSWRAWTKNVVLLIIGLGLIVLGSRGLVWSATEMARAIGVSELLIGLTVVAIGTSLPEVATTLVATLKGERDIAVGNIVGSNVFNILVVLGLGSLLTPGGIVVSETALRFDIPVMIAVAVACLPITFSGHAIYRWEGIVFVAYYVAYMAYLGLDAAGWRRLPVMVDLMAFFVIPLTVLTIVVSALRYWRAGGGDEEEAVP